MTHGPHDQNQGLETPDTAPSRSRVISLAVLMYAIVACAGYFFIVQIGNSVNNPPEPVVETPPVAFESVENPSAYVVSEAAPLFTPAQIRLGNLKTAGSVVELATVLGTFPEIKVIYLDPAAAYTFDPDFIQQQLAAGKTVVGVKVDHDRFVEALGLEPAVNNLSEERKRAALLWVSLLHQEDGEVIQSAQTFDQFTVLLSVAGRFAE